MKVKLDSLKANTKRESEGDWVKATSLPGVEFRVRALTYPPFRAKHDQAMMRLARQHGQNPPSDTIQSELGRLMAEEILLEWRGFDVEYSSAVALDALTDPAHRDLRGAIETCAASLSSVKVEFEEEQEKN